MAKNPHAARSSLLSKIKPSYLVLLCATPFIIYLFLSSASYRDALTYVLPGLTYTLSVSILGYIVASILGLILAGLLMLKPGKRTLTQYLSAAIIMAALSVFFFTRAPATYALIGNPDEGRIAIIQGTPSRISDFIKSGAFLETTDPPTYNIRAVSDVAGVFERLESGVVTAALLPIDEVPADSAVLWETTFLPDRFRNPGVFLTFFSVFLLALTFAAWQGAEHPLTIFAELYIDLIRGIPMLVIVLFIGFVLPGALREVSGGRLDIKSDLLRGILAISLGYAAYMAEIFRAGIEAIPKGQTEASRSLGLSGWQTARYVILPQAIAIVLPPLGNEFIAMLKDTALLSVIGIGDVTRRAREYQARTLMLFPPYNTAAVIYIALTLSASSLLSSFERRTKRSTR